MQENIKQTKPKEEEKTNESASTTRWKKRYGPTDKPFVHVPLDHIIIDELHLMLWITDVLTSILLEEVMERNGKKTNILQGQHLNELIQVIRQCDISFNVWGKKERTGGWGGKYDWTRLMGKDKKRLLNYTYPTNWRTSFFMTAATVETSWKVTCHWL